MSKSPSHRISNLNKVMLLPIVSALGVAPTSLFGNVAIVVQGANFKATDGINPFPDSGLMQLVNLGADGVSNPINEGNWVGGDDVLIDLTYGDGTEFLTSGGFDLSETTVYSPGFLSRIFDFALTPGVLEVGDKIILRWWPEFSASDFFLSSTPGQGNVYGESRIDTAVNDSNNTAWIIPEETELTAIFDPLVSSDYNSSIGGILIETDDFSGMADLIVVPEPSMSGFYVLAISLLLVAGRRRKS